MAWQTSTRTEAGDVTCVSLLFGMSEGFASRHRLRRWTVSLRNTDRESPRRGLRFICGASPLCSDWPGAPDPAGTRFPLAGMTIIKYVLFASERGQSTHFYPLSR